MPTTSTQLLFATKDALLGVLPSVCVTEQVDRAQSVHQITVMTKPVLDLFLVQQIKMVGFGLATGSTFKTVQLQPIPRSVKDAFRSF